MKSNGNILDFQGDEIINFSGYASLDINGNIEASLLPPTVGNTLYVSTLGNDGSAEDHNINRPYQTLNAAVSAAASGDLILVYPGNYTITSSIAKDGVIFYFHPGAKVTMSNGNEMFGDSGNSITCIVKGYGEFYQTHADGKMGNLTGTSSVLDIECSVIVDQRDAGIGSNRGCFRPIGSGCKVILRNCSFTVPTAGPFLVENGATLEAYNLFVHGSYDSIAEIRGGGIGKFYNCKLKSSDAANATPIIGLGPITGGTNTLQLHNCIIQHEGNGLALYSIPSQVIKMVGVNVLMVNSSTYSIQVSSDSSEFRVYGSLIVNKAHNPSDAVNLAIGEYIIDSNAENIL